MKINFEIKKETPVFQNIIQRILEPCRKFNYDREFLGNIRLVAEEIIVNIVKHGYDEKPDIRIELEIDIQEFEWVLTVADNGKPFNPLNYESLNVDKSFDEKGIGGLGIHLVREIAEQIEYKREMNKNCLKIKLLNKTG